MNQKPELLRTNGNADTWYKAAQMALRSMRVEYKINDSLKAIISDKIKYGVTQESYNVAKMKIVYLDKEILYIFKKRLLDAYLFLENQVPLNTVPSNINVRNSKGKGDIAPRIDGSVSRQWNKQPNQNEVTVENDLISLASRGDNEYSVNKKHCKYCNAILTRGSKKCSRCGKEQGRAFKVVIIVVGIVIFLAAIGFLGYKFFISDNSETSTTQQQTSSVPIEQLVTKEQFEKISVGMTYEEICNLFGREGTFLEPEVEDATGAKLKTYYWEANGKVGANVCITFKDGVSVTFSQYGMEE